MNNIKIINKTRFSTKKLKKFIEFVCPKGLGNKNLRIIFTHNSPTFHGSFDFFNNEITVNLNKKLEFPRQGFPREWKKYGYINRTILKNYHETIIHILSHELRHVWQFKVSKQNFKNLRHKVLKMETYYGTFYPTPKLERDACKYSRKMILKYRKQDL